MDRLGSKSAIGGNLWINQDPQMFFQSDVRVLLIHTCQTAITGDVGCEYGCKPPH
jgi:hypothetical protein